MSRLKLVAAIELAVSALIVFRLMNPKQSPQPVVRCAQQNEHPSADTKATSQTRGVILLMLMGFGLLALGYVVHPESDPYPTFSERLELIVDTSPKDVQGAIGWKSVVWDESHRYGFDSTGRQPDPLPLGQEDHMSATLEIGLHRRTMSPARFAMDIAVPIPAFIGVCGLIGMPDTARVSKCDSEHVEGTSWNLFKIEIDLPSGIDYFRVFFEFKSIGGLSLITNDTYALVRYPFVRYQAAEAFSNPPVDVATIATMPNAFEFEWESHPVAASNTQVGWRSPAISLPPAPAYGTKRDAPDKAGDMLFVAGVLLGIGGSAIIAAIQIAVTSRKSTQHN